MRPIYATRRTATVPIQNGTGENGKWKRRLRIQKDRDGGAGLFCRRNEPLKNAEFGAPRAAIMENLRARRHDRLFGPHRPQARVCRVAQRTLYDAVLNAVEGNDDKPPAGRE